MADDQYFVKWKFQKLIKKIEETNSEIPKVHPLSENWLPEQKITLKNGHRKKSDHQMPEQYLVIKNGYRNIAPVIKPGFVPVPY